MLSALQQCCKCGLCDATWAFYKICAAYGSKLVFEIEMTYRYMNTHFTETVDSAK